MIAKPRSIKSIRDDALFIRNILGIKNNEPINIVNLLELVIEKVFNIDQDIIEKKYMPDKYAEYNPIEKKLYIREDTYENACKGIGRDRFTLAHEIGHIFYHSNNIFLSRTNNDSPIYCNPEWQANTFAREFLCPLDGIDSSDTVETIVKKFGVSKEVATIQLEQKK